MRLSILELPLTSTPVQRRMTTPSACEIVESDPRFTHSARGFHRDLATEMALYLGWRLGIPHMRGQGKAGKLEAIIPQAGTVRVHE